MRPSSGREDRKAFSRDDIIGLGQESFRKNYYPELQKKILDLERINARNEALISTIPDLLLVGDLEGNISPFSLSARKQDNAMSDFLSNPDLMRVLKRNVLEAIRSESFYTNEFQLEKNGATYFFEARMQRVNSDEILIMIRNMTDRIKLERRLVEMAEQDGLTRIPNRRSFEDKMRAFNGRELQRISMLSIDVNGLKFINDTLGHLAGDQMIVAAARIIEAVFGAHGHVARIGGDEFGVILEGMDEDEIETLLERLAEAAEQYSLGSAEGLSLSYGYAFHNGGIVNMEHMFQIADNNMYQNKLLKKESIRSAFVSSFMKALEAKDYVVEGHVMRMEALVTRIGEALSLHRDRLDKLILLTRFHDIGKIGIPDSILKKPALLTETEWKVMRTHSSIGERIALEAADIRDIAHLILKHHERWDGGGYPLGLKGDEIPVECRILAIADTFDAMTNDRPYRPAVSCERAILEIDRCAGTQFDPELVGVFLNVIQGFCPQELV